MSLDFALSLGGLVAGVMVGLTGMGGAALVTPMLVLIFGISPAAAVSSDVVASAIMKPVGALVHIRARTVHWGIVGWLSVGSVPGVIIGTVIFGRVLGSSDAGKLIQSWLGWVLIVALAAMLARTWLTARASHLRGEHSPTGRDQRVRPILTVALGAGVGMVVGMTSVGSGSLIITCLLLLYPLLRPSFTVGTDLTQAVPMLIAGAVAHAGFGSVSIAVVISLLIGQIPGVWIGARLSSRYDGHVLRWLLMVVLAATALKLLGVSSLIAGMIAVIGVVVVIGLILRERVSARRARPDLASVSPAPLPRR